MTKENQGTESRPSYKEQDLDHLIKEQDLDHLIKEQDLDHLIKEQYLDHLIKEQDLDHLIECFLSLLNQVLPHFSCA